MIFERLSYSFLLRHTKVDDWIKFRESVGLIGLENFQNRRFSEVALLAHYANLNWDVGFFTVDIKFKDFVNHLPHETVAKLSLEMGLMDSAELCWSEELRNILINSYSLNPRFLVSRANRKKDSIVADIVPRSESPFKALKEHQSAVFFPLSEYLMSNKFARAILQLPTGAGKTRTAVEVACATLNEKSNSVLWLANTEELCNQAVSEFYEIWKHLGKKDLVIRNMQSIHRENSKSSEKFIVTTIQSLINKSEDEIEARIDCLIDSIGLVIVDEAHISIAPKYRESIFTLIKKGAALLGLTATPGRTASEKSDENMKLAKFYNQNLYTYESDDGTNIIEYLRQRGIMANARFHTLEFDAKRRFVQSGIDPEKMTLSKLYDALGESIERNLLIYSTIRNLIFNEKKNKILLFAPSISSSKTIVSLLAMSGIGASHLDSNSGEERRETIKQFNDSSIQVLSNYGILSTGFDDPGIEVVFIGRATESIVLYSQMIGRGLRGPKIGGTDFCDIYTVFDNINRLPDNKEIYDYFETNF